MGVVLSKLCRTFMNKLYKAISRPHHHSSVRPSNNNTVTGNVWSRMGIISVTAVLLFGLFDVHYFIRGILLFIRCKLRSRTKPDKDPLKESVIHGETVHVLEVMKSFEELIWSLLSPYIK